MRRPPRSPLFPYTTLFRSVKKIRAGFILLQAGMALGLIKDCIKIMQEVEAPLGHDLEDRKSTRLNSSHVAISYAVFCLKKKNCIRTSCLCQQTSSSLLNRS